MIYRSVSVWVAAPHTVQSTHFRIVQSLEILIWVDAVLLWRAAFFVTITTHLLTRDLCVCVCARVFIVSANSSQNDENRCNYICDTRIAIISRKIIVLSLPLSPAAFKRKIFTLSFVCNLHWGNSNKFLYKNILLWKKRTIATSTATNRQIQSYRRRGS